MENASKALIIAGAILISILLISVGVLIMNSTDDTTDSVSKSAADMAIRTFNSKFIPYVGSGQSASQIRSLVSAVNSSNANDPDHPITLDPSDINRQLKSSTKYTVDVDYADTGYIGTIHIKAESKSGK